MNKIFNFFKTNTLGIIEFFAKLKFFANKLKSAGLISFERSVKHTQFGRKKRNERQAKTDKVTSGNVEGSLLDGDVLIDDVAILLSLHGVGSSFIVLLIEG